ncbi:MAG: host attachment protein [Gammaproteobacteria bacterium]
MSRVWVVAADSRRARIFATDTPTGSLREMEDLVHPAARTHARELTSDRPGRSFDSHGPGRHAMEPETNVKRHEAEVFAKQVAERIERARLDDEFDELVLIAAPEFLGLLRKSLSPTAIGLVAKAVDKSVADLSASAIREYLL